MSAIGTKRTYLVALHMSALGVKRTSRKCAAMSAFDRNRTLGSSQGICIRFDREKLNRSVRDLLHRRMVGAVLDFCDEIPKLEVPHVGYPAQTRKSVSSQAPAESKR